MKSKATHTRTHNVRVVWQEPELRIRGKNCQLLLRGHKLPICLCIPYLGRDRDVDVDAYADADADEEASVIWTCCRTDAHPFHPATINAATV